MRDQRHRAAQPTLASQGAKLGRGARALRRQATEVDRNDLAPVAPCDRRAQGPTADAVHALDADDDFLFELDHALRELLGNARVRQAVGALDAARHFDHVAGAAQQRIDLVGAFEEGGDARREAVRTQAVGVALRRRAFEQGGAHERVRRREREVERLIAAEAEDLRHHLRREPLPRLFTR